VVGVENAAFDGASQTVRAVLKDARGDLAVLSHPFTSRAASGSERLLTRLTASPQGVRFVAGSMRVTAEGLLVEPVAVVFQDEARAVVQPWIDRGDESHEGEAVEQEEEQRDAVQEFRRESLSAVGQLMLLGLRRADTNAVRTWDELARLADGLGVARLGKLIDRVVTGLAERAAVVRWDAGVTGRAVLELAALVRFAQDVG
jgi:hypothetical protein